MDSAAVVIDNGSGFTKAGFAGDLRPAVVFPTVLAQPRDDEKRKELCGENALRAQANVVLRRPVEARVIVDFDDMEKVWAHTFSNELRVSSERQPVLLAEGPLNPKANREKSAEILFERFRAPALYNALQAVLAFQASGRLTGIAVDSGDSVTHVVPIYEGYALPQAVKRQEIGGADLTAFMEKLLRERGYAFETQSELEIVRNIKEKLAFVAGDFDADAAKLAAAGAKNFELPDGQVITIGAEQVKVPEIIFSPQLYTNDKSAKSLPITLLEAVSKCSLSSRRELYGNIVLVGGNTLLPNLGERLAAEVTKLVPKSTRVRVVSPPERKFSAWIGGSIIAAMPTFRNFWITKQEYHDAGPSVLWRRLN